MKARRASACLAVNRAAMTEIVRCAAGPGGGGVRVERRDGRNTVIDIHCHFHAAAGDAVLRPYAPRLRPSCSLASAHPRAMP